jgi:hypothetical protein
MSTSLSISQYIFSFLIVSPNTFLKEEVKLLLFVSNLDFLTYENYKKHLEEYLN